MSYQSEWFACAFKQYFLGNTAVVMQCVIAAKFWLVIPIPWTINPTILYAVNLWAHFCTFIVQYTKPMRLFRNILEQFLTSPVVVFFLLISYAAKTSKQRWFITNGINFSQLRSCPGSVLWVIGQIASKDEISPIQDEVWVPPIVATLSQEMARVP